MCGRYYVDEDMLAELQSVIKYVDERLKVGRYAKDIFPADWAPVIETAGQNLRLAMKKWGYPGIQNRGVIFNARAETVREKSRFRNGIEHHRIVIPARHFYEWNASKEKFTFQRNDSGILFLAGFSDLIGNEPRFIILTTQANDSMAKVHDRMPLILERNQVREWIEADSSVDRILRQTPALLERWTDYEQQTLF